MLTRYRAPGSFRDADRAAVSPELPWWCIICGGLLAAALPLSVAAQLSR